MPKETYEEMIESLRNQVSELKDANERMELTLTNLIQKVSNDNNDMRICINSLNNKCSETFVVSSLLRQFLTRFNSQDIDALKANKTKKKSSKTKTTETINRIDALEVSTREPENSKYNIFVGLVKGKTDFAEKLAISWSEVDDAIIPNANSIDYVKFYETFITSTIPEDSVPDALKTYREQVWKAHKKSKKNK